MTDFPIEKGIPIPERHYGRKKNYDIQNLLDKIEVGDSVFFAYTKQYPNIQGKHPPQYPQTRDKHTQPYQKKKETRATQYPKTQEKHP